MNFLVHQPEGRSHPLPTALPVTPAETGSEPRLTTDLSFSDATITVEQPVGATVLTVYCSFNEPTSNGPMSADNVTCTSKTTEHFCYLAHQVSENTELPLFLRREMLYSEVAQEGMAVISGVELGLLVLGDQRAPLFGLGQHGGLGSTGWKRHYQHKEYAHGANN